MSYASKFTSGNRFAALSEDAEVAAAAFRPAAAAAAAAAAPTTSRVWQQDARTALASDDGNRRPTHTIFRRNAVDTSAPVHSAFQGMHVARTSGSGYQGLFKEPPKKYEDEFPSLGGKSAALAAKSATVGPSKFADLAKSWATTDADATAAAAAANAAAATERERRTIIANASHSSSIYENIIARRRAAMESEPVYDYNEEVYRNQRGLDDEEGGRSSPYSSHTPPYGHNEGAYDVDQYAEDQEH